MLTHATFKLDMDDPQDLELLHVIGRDERFPYFDDWLEATSVRHSRNGVFVTARAVKP